MSVPVEELRKLSQLWRDVADNYQNVYVNCTATKCYLSASRADAMREAYLLAAKELDQVLKEAEE